MTPLNSPRSLLLLLALLATPFAAAEEAAPPPAYEFALKEGVTTDESMKRSADAPAPLKVEPGGKAVLELRETDGAGEVTFWVYDDKTVSKAEGKRHTGPQWGLRQANGDTLFVSIRYAPYLNKEEGSYTLTEFDGGEFAGLKYLGGRSAKKGPKWDKWTFRFDPKEGATLLLNDKPQDNRWNWNESHFPGFSGIVIEGDSPGGDSAQTIWIEPSYTLAGEMEVAPVPPPPPPPVVPDEDPALEGEPPAFNEKLMGEHPRLLFSEDEIADLRAFYESEAGSVWRKKLEDYLAPSTPPAPDKVEFPGNATDGQRQGKWRMPTVGLHYVLTGDPQSFEKAKGFLEMLLEVEPWEGGKERDSGMSSANIMTGAALVFDWLYDDLDPEFREKFRQRLWYQARAQYYGGHLKGNPPHHYWQNDPQNNHRWHRNSGMTLAVLAAYTGEPEQAWMLAKLKEELQFIHDWLPHDGTSHEGSGYLTFGGNYLALAFDASDRCLGTDFLDHAFFENIGYFRLLSLTSGMQNVLPFGDNAQGGLGSYSNFYFLGAAHHEQDSVMARLRKFEELNPKATWLGWISLIWDDPDLGREPVEQFPRIGYFPDVGTTYFHDSWAPDGISAMFRCGPLGGFLLNDFRNQNDYTYINVAHDDPDANSFVIAEGDTLLAQTSGYSMAKQSSNHNTILVNGIGQHAVGRGPLSGYNQPARQGVDMNEMAFTTGWLHSGSVTAIEGEAAGAYPANRQANRPDLDRYRRSFFWVEGEYVLILDDIRAPEAVDITWLLQAEKVEQGDGGQVTLKANDKVLPVVIAADREFASKVGLSTADHRKEPLGWEQLQAEAEGVTAIRFASVYDPWKRGVSVTLETTGPDSAKVTVTGEGFTDEWTWNAAIGADIPSGISATRTSGEAPDGFPVDFSTSTKPSVHGPPVLIPEPEK